MTQPIFYIAVSPSSSSSGLGIPNCGVVVAVVTIVVGASIVVVTTAVVDGTYKKNF